MEPTQPPSIETIRTFLEANPKLFDQLCQQLAKSVPENEEAMQEWKRHQDKRLREQNEKLQLHLRQLIGNANANSGREKKMQEMTDVLLAIQDRKSNFGTNVITAIREIFAIPMIALKLAHPVQKIFHSDWQVDSKDKNYQSLLLRIAHRDSISDDRLSTALRDYLFAEQASEIQSCALIPVPDPDTDKILGILALADSDAQRFADASGNLYSNRLGAMLGITWKRISTAE